MDVPIACTLTESELRERRRTILASIRNDAVEKAPSATGYVYRFEASGDVLARLAYLVDLERQCCPFLTFKIVVEPNAPIALEITGPPEARDLITDLFG